MNVYIIQKAKMLYILYQDVIYGPLQILNNCIKESTFIFQKYGILLGTHLSFYE